jgi:hypothetical protein
MKGILSNCLGIAAICFCVMAACALVVSAQVPAFQNTNTISGFIFNESRAPVAQIYIELQSDFYATVGRVQTRSSGMFTFSGLAPGQYYLRVITMGTDYEEQTKSVTLAAISRQLANTQQVDFYLRSRRTRSGGGSAVPGVVFVQEVPI